MPTLAAIVAGTGFYSPRLVGGKACNAGCSVILVREPGNPHDANAIAVHVGTTLLGLFPRRVKIGHLKAPLAKRLAPILDSGAEVRATIASTFTASDVKHPRVSLSIHY